MSDGVKILPKGLEAFTHKVLTQLGSTPHEAEVVADHLVRANLTGHDSHGVGLLPTYVRHLQEGLAFPNRPMKVVQDAGSILMMDGQRGFGQRIAKEAMELALGRAKQLGLVAMTLRNAHHIGRIGTYGEQSLAAGLISLHFVNVTDHPPVVAPFGGSDARMVTNPVCVAISGETPVLLDMATSAIALGKARVAMNSGVPTPEGSIIDAQGKPTTNPNVMFT
ncbi:MAG: Ldh family oxidoreductase, partial [Deinococcota bacterium]